MTPETLRRLTKAQRDRQLAVLATRLPDGAQILLVQQGDDLMDESGTAAPDGMAAAALAAGERSQLAEFGGESWFLHIHAPAPRLLVIGAVHVAQALAPLARIVGLAVTVIDPRESFATVERFPGAALMTIWPDDALRELRIDRHSAVVTLTHDPKLDDPALDVALTSSAFYVGALGSRKTQAARRERLRAAGHDDATLDRIRGPVGLAIGAIGAPEIALSILAEIVAVRRGGALAIRTAPRLDAAGNASGSRPE